MFRKEEHPLTIIDCQESSVFVSAAPQSRLLRLSAVSGAKQMTTDGAKDVLRSFIHPQIYWSARGLRSLGARVDRGMSWMGERGEKKVIKMGAISNYSFESLLYQ